MINCDRQKSTLLSFLAGEMLSWILSNPRCLAGYTSGVAGYFEHCVQNNGR